MNRVATQPGRDWAIACAGAVLVAGLVALLFGRVAVRPLVAPGSRYESTGLSAAWAAGSRQPAVAEAARLMDPAVLFLPTALSAEHKVLTVNPLREKFSPLPPSFAFQPGELRLSLPPPIAMPASLADALTRKPPGNPLLGIGRTDERPPPLPAREAAVDITSIAKGRVVLFQSLPVGTGPNLVPNPGFDWQPATFYASVDPAGLVGPIVAAPRRPGDGPFPPLDSDALERIENILDHRLDLGQRLAPGFYRITVGP